MMSIAFTFANVAPFAAATGKHCTVDTKGVGATGVTTQPAIAALAAALDRAAQVLEQYH